MIYTRVVDHTGEIYDTSCRPSPALPKPLIGSYCPSFRGLCAGAKKTNAECRCCLIDPVTGMPTQHGGTLGDSAKSVVQYLVLTYVIHYGLPAVEAYDIQ